MIDRIISVKNWSLYKKQEKNTGYGKNAYNLAAFTAILLLSGYASIQSLYINATQQTAKIILTILIIMLLCSTYISTHMIQYQISIEFDNPVLSPTDI